MATNYQRLKRLEKLEERASNASRKKAPVSMAKVTDDKVYLYDAFTWTDDDTDKPYLILDFDEFKEYEKKNMCMTYE